MIRAHSLQDYELEQYRALENERLQLFAQIGALTMDLEAAKARRGDLESRSRSFVGAVTARQKLPPYRWAKIEAEQLIVDIIEQPGSGTPQLMRPQAEVITAEEATKVNSGAGKH